jgi:hypothetical protein
MLDYYVYFKGRKNMKKGLFRKGLVLGIIFLFIGVGIQPAFANDFSKNVLNDNKDDCDVCLSIKKIKSLTNKKENKKLYNMINQKLENDKTVGDFRPICLIITLLVWQFLARTITLAKILDKIGFYDNFPNLFSKHQDSINFRFEMYITLWFKFNC